MEIYLVNPKHGRKIAYAELEAQLDKKNGWKQVSKYEYYPRNKEKDSERTEEAPIAAASAQNVTKTGKQRKKPGPKPKNRLNDGDSTEFN